MKACASAFLILGWLTATTAFAADRCAPVLESKDDSAVARDLKRAAELCRTVALEPKPDGNPSLKRTLAAVFAPKGTGGDRLKPPAPMGMPTGPVMPRDGQVAFDATEVASEGLVSLSITGQGVSVPASALPAGGTLLLSATQMRADTDYRWILTTRRQRYEGMFSLPDAETMTRVRSRLQALAEATPDARTRLLFEATIYDDEELFATRDLVVLAYRRELRN